MPIAGGPQAGQHGDDVPSPCVREWTRSFARTHRRLPGARQQDFAGRPVGQARTVTLKPERREVAVGILHPAPLVNDRQELDRAAATRWRGIALVTLLMVTPITLRAQTRGQIRADSGGCLGCAARPRFVPAAAELLTFELLPYSYNRWIAKVPWGQTTLHTWSSNLRHGWVWDTDHFPVNQVAHPYSGNLFFNSARSHGYDFWGAAPFSFAGSTLWEYFGETTRPSINDLINTTVGGITLGETTYRLSNLILDRRTTGLRRVAGEIGSALVDPPLALTRLIDGDIGRVEANPIDREPSRLAQQVAFGYQLVSQGKAQSPLLAPHQSFGFYSLDYGDPLAGDVTHPFGAFRVTGTLATGTSGTVSQLDASGYLATHDFLKTKTQNQEVQLTLNYSYLNNRAILTGGQSVSGLFISRYPIARSLSVRTEFSLVGYLIDGVKSDFSPSPQALQNETARNYDYGMGGGGRVVARLERRGYDLLQASYSDTWIGVLSGAARRHRYDTLGGRVEIPIIGPLAIGGSALLYRRTSQYSGHDTVHARDARTQIFAAVLY